MKIQLLELGYSLNQISEMTPTVAHNIITNKIQQKDNPNFSTQDNTLNTATQNNNDNNANNNNNQSESRLNSTESTITPLKEQTTSVQLTTPKEEGKTEVQLASSKNETKPLTLQNTSQTDSSKPN